MANTSAWFSAAGEALIRATQRQVAASASQPDPAASTEAPNEKPRKRRKMRSTATEHASASKNGFALLNEDWNKIVSLLMWMACDFASNFHIHDIEHAALDVMSKHAAADQALGSLHTASLAKLSEIIDIMMLHKDGTPKDPSATLAFMRRLVKIRNEYVTERPCYRATIRNARATLSDIATDLVQLNGNEVALCYNRFSHILLTDYLVESNTHLARFQRSIVDNLLREVLGDKRVAFLIWQHGIPSIATHPGTHRYGHAAEIDIGMLQSELEECLQWYVFLANDIVDGFYLPSTASGSDTLPVPVQSQCHNDT